MCVCVCVCVCVCILSGLTASGTFSQAFSDPNSEQVLYFVLALSKYMRVLRETGKLTVEKQGDRNV